jgi:hypothetical protein
VELVFWVHDEGLTGQCEGIAGLDTYSNEESVVALLGPPTKTRGPTASGRKYIEFGKKSRVTFALKKGHVELIAVGDGLSQARPDDKEKHSKEEPDTAPPKS